MRLFTAISAFVIVLLSVSGADAAIELKPSPIQTQMSAAMSSPTATEYAEIDWNNQQDSARSEQPEVGRKKVSVAKAALLSALLPGLGEYYAGSTDKAKYFFGAEALTWVGFFAFRTYGSWKKDDLIRFASEHANASLEDKDDEFLDWVGFYEDIDAFNTLGRVSDPDRDYLVDTPDNHWRWDSELNQEAYREIKNASREAYRRSEFMIGVAVVNRIISVIDAVRDARRARRGFDDEFSDDKGFNYKLTIDPLDIDQQVKLTIYTPF